jgi:D-glycero-alpha-D-manno-heptose-7-phosphate kinase
MNRGTGDQLVVARTPLRLTLGGGGTDLPLYAERFGGDMLTVAISLWVTVVARQGCLDGHHRYSYEQTEFVDVAGRFGDPYVREAFDMVGLTEPCEVVSMGPVPAGTGLGSSGAFTVSLLAALHALAGGQPTRVDLAEQAHRLEAERIGMPIGKQDHYACGLGGLRRLTIDSTGKVRTSLIAMPAGVATALDRRLLLFYTGQRRDSATQLAVPRAQVELSERVEQLHHIRKLGNETRVALENGALGEVPRLMSEHWNVKRTREATARWDRYLALARRHGAQAGKIVGAGGGGFLLLYVDPDAAAGVVGALAAEGLRHVPFQFVDEGTTVTALPAPTQLEVTQ